MKQTPLCDPAFKEQACYVGSLQIQKGVGILAVHLLMWRGQKQRMGQALKVAAKMMLSRYEDYQDLMHCLHSNEHLGCRYHETS